MRFAMALAALVAACNDDEVLYDCSDVRDRVAQEFSACVARPFWGMQRCGQEVRANMCRPVVCGGRRGPQIVDGAVTLEAD